MKENVYLYPTVLIFKDQTKLAFIQNAIHEHNQYCDMYLTSQDNTEAKEYFWKNEISCFGVQLLKIEILGIGKSVRSVLEMHPNPKCVIIESESRNDELRAWQSISKRMGLMQKSTSASNFQTFITNDFDITSPKWKDVLSLIYDYANVQGNCAIELM